MWMPLAKFTVAPLGLVPFVTRQPLIQMLDGRADYGLGRNGQRRRHKYLGVPNPTPGFEGHDHGRRRFLGHHTLDCSA